MFADRGSQLLMSVNNVQCAVTQVPQRVCKPVYISQNWMPDAIQFVPSKDMIAVSSESVLGSGSIHFFSINLHLLSWKWGQKKQQSCFIRAVPSYQVNTDYVIGSFGLFQSSLFILGAADNTSVSKISVYNIDTKLQEEKILPLPLTAYGISVSPKGQVAVSCAIDGKVFIVDTSLTEVMKIIGTGIRGSQDGSLKEFWLNSPVGVCWVGEDLWITDVGTSQLPSIKIFASLEFSRTYCHVVNELYKISGFQPTKKALKFAKKEISFDLRSE